MKLESEKHFLTNLRLFRDTVLYVVATYHRKETFLGNNYNQKPKKKSRITNFVTMYQKGKILQNCPDPNACHANDANTYYVWQTLDH